MDHFEQSIRSCGPVRTGMPLKHSRTLLQAVFGHFAIGFLLAALLGALLIEPIRAGSIKYTYDGAGRLVRAVYDNGAVISYTYDNNGNLLQRRVSLEVTGLFFPFYQAQGTTFVGFAVSNFSSETANLEFTAFGPDGTLLPYPSNPSTFALDSQNQLAQLVLDEFARLELHALEKRKFQIRKNALRMLIESRLLRKEADRRGVSLERLWEELTTAVQVKDHDVEAEYLANLSRFGLPKTPAIEARARLKATLELDKQSLALRDQLDLLWEKHPPSILLEEPEEPRVIVDSSGPSWGPLDAPVTIVEFSDFQCPFCKQTRGMISALREAFPGAIRLVYKHLPGTTHPEALGAAKAAICAGEQGEFWAYHDLLFDNSRQLKQPNLQNYAKQLGLVVDDFDACVLSPSTIARIESDRLEAKRLGIDSTPSFVLNGQLLVGDFLSNELFAMGLC